MNFFTTRLYFVLIVVIALFTIKCVSNFAGGTGDVDNKTICGKLFEPDGISPAQGATVVMRPQDYLPDMTRLPKRSANDSNFVRLIHTDDSGYYKFYSIPKGIYCIEGRDSRNNCVLIDSIKIDSTLDAIDTLLLQDTLKPPATAIIEGKIQPYNDSTQAYIRVFGLDVYEKVSSNGNFYLYDLPEGNLKMRITIMRGKLTSYDTIGIKTNAGDTTIILPGSIINYNGNENTAGILPVDDNYYKAGEMATVLGNIGNLVRNCYTFFGWNTESNGSGTTYKPGDTFEMGKKNVTLYALWTKNYYIIVFEKNDTAASGTMAAETIDCGSSVKLNANEFSKTGWEFAGWAKSSSGAVSYDNRESYTMGSANVTLYAKWNGAGIVTDIDGNVYHTVTIGAQTWTVENLKTTKYNDGTPIRESITGDTLAGYCWYNNDSVTYKDAYGAFYNWYTVNTGKLAPAGWHVPTDAEWDILQNCLIENRNYWDCDGTTFNKAIAKSLAAKKDWTSSPYEGTIGCDLTKNNSSGFSALPGGVCSDRVFYAIGHFCCFWSATEFDTSKAWTRDLYFYDADLTCVSIHKSYGLSVRLLRD
jgi:uncharacterized protein (TIGR02145 family)/uncharacterized repeat protein (TIGR02543 family)